MIILPKMALLLSGVAGLATLIHSVIALRGKMSRGDGYFALFCFCVIPYSLLAAEQLSAVSEESFIRMVHAHMFCAALGLSGFLWFCAQFSKWKPLPFLWSLTAVLNLSPWIQLFSSKQLLYSKIQGLRQVVLPWGERIQFLDAQNGILLNLFELLVLCVLGFSLLAGIRQFRRGDRWHGAWLTGGVLGFGVFVLNDVVINAFGITWIHMAEFGFVFLVIFFTVLLYQELWTAENLKRRLGEAELQLIRSQRLEAMGTLAGGLAHDFNNILSGIGGANYLIVEQLMKMNPSPLVTETRNYTVMVERSVSQASILTRQLLNLGRTGDFRLMPIEANQLIQETLQLCRGLISSAITVHFQPVPEPVFMLAEPSMAKQVMVNLCLNACQAMTSMRSDAQPIGGRLIIRITPEKIELPYESSQSEFIVLEVEDTGVGISPEALKNIFEPFFTTKGKEGNGLGLSTAYNIMKQHGGFLTAASELGEGTCFRAGFPSHDR